MLSDIFNRLVCRRDCALLFFFPFLQQLQSGHLDSERVQLHRIRIKIRDEHTYKKSQVNLPRVSLPPSDLSCLIKK